MLLFQKKRRCGAESFLKYCMLIQKLYISLNIHSIALTCPQERSAYTVLPDHNMEVSRNLPVLVSFISICILLCGVKTMLGVLFMFYIPACWMYLSNCSFLLPTHLLWKLLQNVGTIQNGIHQMWAKLSNVRMDHACEY